MLGFIAPALSSMVEVLSSSAFFEDRSVTNRLKAVANMTFL